MVPKLGQRRSRASAPFRSEGPEGEAVETLRTVLKGYLSGGRLIAMKVAQQEGPVLSGILKVRDANGDLRMMDFKATLGAGKGLSYLEVGGRKIPLKA